jgi:hypothetical protein
VAKGINVAAAWMLWWSVVAVMVLTLFYGYFGRDDWGYVRLLLPVFPPLLIVSSALARHGIAALVPRAAPRIISVVLAATGLACWQLNQAGRRGVFDLHHVERRYADVGRFVNGATAPNAVFLAGLHSGSIRYYANRMTMYFPRLRQGSLDLAVRTLQEQGHDVYIVLEDGERSSFTARFETSALSQLDWPPAHRLSGGAPVNIWNPRDR